MWIRDVAMLLKSSDEGEGGSGCMVMMEIGGALG